MHTTCMGFIGLPVGKPASDVPPHWSMLTMCQSCRLEMLLMMVTDSGHVWQWSVAVPPLGALPAPMAAGSGAAAASLLRPRLLGVNSHASNHVVGKMGGRTTDSLAGAALELPM